MTMEEGKNSLPHCKCPDYALHSHCILNQRRSRPQTNTSGLNKWDQLPYLDVVPSPSWPHHLSRSEVSRGGSLMDHSTPSAAITISPRGSADSGQGQLNSTLLHSTQPSLCLPPLRIEKSIHILDYSSRVTSSVSPWFIQATTITSRWSFKTQAADEKMHKRGNAEIHKSGARCRGYCYLPLLLVVLRGQTASFWSSLSGGGLQKVLDLLRFRVLGFTLVFELCIGITDTAYSAQPTTGCLDAPCLQLDTLKPLVGGTHHLIKNWQHNVPKSSTTFVLFSTK